MQKLWITTDYKRITSTGKSCSVHTQLLDLSSNFETEESIAVFRKLPPLGSQRLIPPFLYSVGGLPKSPSSLCLSLRALLCLCWISCPTTQTEPLGKPNSQSHPPPASHACSRVRLRNYFADIDHFLDFALLYSLWSSRLTYKQFTKFNSIFLHNYTIYFCFLLRVCRLTSV